MINLLPTETKKELRSSITNVRLINYIITLLAGTIFLGMVSTAAYLVLVSTKEAAENTITLNAQRSESYSSVKARFNALKTSVDSAGAILSNETNYSKILTQFAAVVPEGVIVETLTLNDASFTTPTTITAYAKTNEIALGFKEKLSNSNIASGVKLDKLTANTNTNIANYPISVTMSLTFMKVSSR